MKKGINIYLFFKIQKIIINQFYFKKNFNILNNHTCIIYHLLELKEEN